MTVSHTPGPWYVRGRYSDLVTATDPGHPNAMIDVADCRGDMDEATILANARLIAAAPDLLAACQAARTILRTHIPAEQFDGHAASALLMVRDAIDRATAAEEEGATP